MDYSKHYNWLIQRATHRVNNGCHFEQHHIIPRCMGGSDSLTNLVLLTPEEHFVAHQLLVKMYPLVKGLVYACIKMNGNPHKKRSNKLYGWIRRRHAKTTSERMLGNKYAKGRTQANEEKSKRSSSLKEYYRTHDRTDEHKRKNVEAYNNSEKVKLKKDETERKRIEMRLLKSLAPKQPRVINNPKSADSYVKTVATRRANNNGQWQSKESYVKMWETRRLNKQLRIDSGF